MVSIRYKKFYKGTYFLFRKIKCAKNSKYLQPQGKFFVTFAFVVAQSVLFLLIKSIKIKCFITSFGTSSTNFTDFFIIFYGVCPYKLMNTNKNRYIFNKNCFADRLLQIQYNQQHMIKKIIM